MSKIPKRRSIVLIDYENIHNIDLSPFINKETLQNHIKAIFLPQKRLIKDEKISIVGSKVNYHF
jgi:hypothetical protein